MTKNHLQRAIPVDRPAVDRTTFITSSKEESFEAFRFAVNKTDAFEKDWDHVFAKLDAYWAEADRAKNE
ncbi:MAG: hypothetical protein LBI54_05655 [Lachnospiraceae bacterium]|nr:hypothetical protein [Lachnospiraceae bacterium]